MRIHKNIENDKFRFTLILETNEKLSHKLLSEDLKLQETVTDLLQVSGEYIIKALNDETKERNL